MFSEIFSIIHNTFPISGLLSRLFRHPREISNLHLVTPILILSFLFHPFHQSSHASGIAQLHRLSLFVLRQSAVVKKLQMSSMMIVDIPINQMNLIFSFTTSLAMFCANVNTLPPILTMLIPILIAYSMMPHTSLSWTSIWMLAICRLVFKL